MRFLFFLIVGMIMSSSFLSSAHAERYFAQIENDTVVNVIVAEQSFISHLTGKWIETYRNQINKTYAGIGYSYNTTIKQFSPPAEPPEVKIANQIIKVNFDQLKQSWIISGNITVVTEPE